MPRADLHRTMKANRKKTAVAITALVIVASLYFQHRTNIGLQKRLASLTDQLKASDEARQKAEQNAPKASAAAKLLQNQLSELPRLRGEVAVLRRENAEKTAVLAKLQNQHNISGEKQDQAKPAISAFGTEVRDFGAATPERAATSLIWAATSGHKQRLSELLELAPNIPETEAPRYYDYFANMLSNKFSQFEFTEIKSVRPNPDGTLRLGIMYREPESGRTNPFPFMMRQHESGWKVVVEGDAPKKM
jgi:hypothetical protein